MTQADTKVEVPAPAVAEAVPANGELKRLLDRPMWSPPTPQETQAALPSLIEQADIYFKGGVAGNKARREDVIARILYGWELGKPPMWSIQNVSVSKDGRPALSAAAMRGLFLERVKGAKLAILKMEADECVIEACRPGQKPLRMVWNEEDSQRAGLRAEAMGQSGKYITTHGKYPKEMKLARCSGRLARAYWPDVLGGATYTPEELEDAVADPSPAPERDADAPQAPTREERQAQPTPPPDTAPPAPNPRRDIALALLRYFPDEFPAGDAATAKKYLAAVPRLAAMVRKCDIGMFRLPVDLGWTDDKIADDCIRQLDAWKAEGVGLPLELFVPIPNEQVNP